MRAAAIQKLLSTSLSHLPRGGSSHVKCPLHRSSSSPPSTDSPHPRTTLQQWQHPRSCLLPHQSPSAPSPPHSTTSTDSSGLRLPAPKSPSSQSNPPLQAACHVLQRHPNSQTLTPGRAHLSLARAGAPRSLKWSLIECHCAHPAGQGSDPPATTALRGAEESS
jgi:hypothetical protein